MDEIDCCALDGCDAVIMQPPGDGPRRKYCSVAHRAAGRRLRRAEQTERKTNLGATPSVRTSLTVPPEQFMLPDDVAVDDTMNAEPIEDVEVPERLRVKAGKRREDKRQDKRRGSEKKPLRPQGAGRVGRRAAIALGAVGALVGGTITVTNTGTFGAPAASRVPAVGQATTQAPNITKPPPATSPAVQNVASWTEQLGAKLAAVRQQRDALQQARKAWLAMPAEQRTGPAPAPVAALGARMKVVEQAEDALMLQAQTLDSLKDTQSMYAGAQSRSASANQAVAAIPADQASAEQKALRQQLVDQQKMYDDQQRKLKEQTDALESGLKTAMASPLAVLPEATLPIVKSVVALTKPQRPKPASASKPRPPAVHQNVPQRPEAPRGAAPAAAPPKPGSPVEAHLPEAQAPVGTPEPAGPPSLPPQPAPPLTQSPLGTNGSPALPGRSDLRPSDLPWSSDLEKVNSLTELVTQQADRQQPLAPGNGDGADGNTPVSGPNRDRGPSNAAPSARDLRDQVAKQVVDRVKATVRDAVQETSGGRSTKSVDPRIAQALRIAERVAALAMELEGARAGGRTDAGPGAGGSDVIDSPSPASGPPRASAPGRSIPDTVRSGKTDLAGPAAPVESTPRPRTKAQRAAASAPTSTSGTSGGMSPSASSSSATLPRPGQPGSGSPRQPSPAEANPVSAQGGHRSADQSMAAGTSRGMRPVSAHGR